MIVLSAAFGVFGTASIAIAVGIIVPLVMSLVLRARVKEERRTNAEFKDRPRTRMARWQNITVIVLIALLSAAMIVGTVFAAVDKEYALAVAFIAVNVIFTGGFLTLYFYIKLRYEVVQDNRIILVRAFGRKKKEYELGKDIVYFSYTPGVYGALILYDKYGVIVASISQLTAGVSVIAQKVQENGVKLVALPFPPPHAKQTLHYRHQNIKSRALLRRILFFGCGALMAVAAFAALMGNEKVPEFLNTPVSGAVEKVTYGYERVEIKLQDDETTYLVNNIAYQALDVEALKEVFAPDTTTYPAGEINLRVAYIGEKGIKNLSEIEFGGKTFMYKEAVKNEKQKNYEMGVGVDIFLWAAAGILLILGAAFVFIDCKRLAVPVPEDEPVPQMTPNYTVTKYVVVSGEDGRPFLRVEKTPLASKPADPFADEEQNSDPFGEEYDSDKGSGGASAVADSALNSVFGDEYGGESGGRFGEDASDSENVAPESSSGENYDTNTEPENNDTVKTENNGNEPNGGSGGNGD